MVASDRISPLVTAGDALLYINKYACLEDALQFIRVVQLLIEFNHACSLSHTARPTIPRDKTIRSMMTRSIPSSNHVHYPN